MQANIKKRWTVFAVCFLICLMGLFVVNAALLDLDAFVTFSLYDEFLLPLPDGALIYIVGSGDAVNDGMFEVGASHNGMATNSFLAYSTLGDDDILGTVRIGDNNSSNGTFTTTVQYNPDEIGYVYIRFFSWTQAAPPTGIVYWGTSLVFELVPTLGVARVDFNPNSNQVLSTSNVNNFTVIPEPGTGNLMVLFLAVLGGLRARMKRQAKLASGTSDQA